MKNKFYAVEGNSECEIAKEMLDAAGVDYEQKNLSKEDAEFSGIFFPQLLTKRKNCFGIFEIKSFINSL